MIERYVADRPGARLIVSRISFDILGFLADDVCEVRLETIRPGRTIELVEATLLDRRTGGHPRAGVAADRRSTRQLSLAAARGR